MLLSPARNCRTLARAARAAVLVDGASYFTSLEAALRLAQRSILILGWDFDGRIRLRPDTAEDVSPPLGDLLRQLVEARPDLEVHILVWSVSVVHGPSAVLPNVVGSAWADHPRIHFRLDTRHPVYAAHHQKIVCIDGRIAFVGGIDLTVRRWDTGAHDPADPHRRDPDGNRYAPVHDVQMLVDGQAAATLCGLAVERWRRATGQEPSFHASIPREDPWPSGLEPDFRDVEVAVALTAPAYGKEAETVECARLTLDMIAGARQSIYIEAQYLTAPIIGRALEKRLAEARGPDVVVVMTLESRGLIERFAMGNNRDRLLRRLARADHRRRLRALYPVVPNGEEDQQVLIHAKLIAVDDVALRLGSSNLNNRSIALDTECDLAIASGRQQDRAAIAALRNRLLAEHLDVAPDAVADALRETGSLALTVDKLNGNRRGLRPFPALSDGGPLRPLPGTGLLDPVRPFGLRSLLRFRGLQVPRRMGE